MQVAAGDDFRAARLDILDNGSFKVTGGDVKHYLDLTYRSWLAKDTGPIKVRESNRAE